MSNETIICHCAQVNKGAILAAVASGCCTLKQIKAATGLCPSDRNCAVKSPRGRCCCSEAAALLAYALEGHT